jgi:hypothetical protein
VIMVVKNLLCGGTPEGCRKLAGGKRGARNPW